MKRAEKAEKTLAYFKAHLERIMDMDEKELKVPCQDKSLLWGGQNCLKYKYAYAVIADALANSIDNV